jgi:hypothetical protein
LYGENFEYVLMNMRIYCYDLVGVDSKTLIPYLLIIFTLFSLCFLFIINQFFFGTRLGFNLIDLDIKLFSRTQFFVGLTSHLQNPLL